MVSLGLRDLAQLGCLFARDSPFGLDQIRDHRALLNPRTPEVCENGLPVVLRSASHETLRLTAGNNNCQILVVDSWRAAELPSNRDR